MSLPLFWCLFVVSGFLVSVLMLCFKHAADVIIDVKEVLYCLLRKSGTYHWLCKV